jgi:RecA-family ATPase
MKQLVALADIEADAALPPIKFLDPRGWQDQPVPERQWVVTSRIPRAQVTLLSGDGAAGKTTIAQQLLVAVALRREDWLGGIIAAAGPVIFISGEETDEDTHIRFAPICEYFGVQFRDLENIKLLCLPDAAGLDVDLVLGRANKANKVQPTMLFKRLVRDARTIRPVLIVIESLADVFDGMENDRGQARQFIALLRRLAIVSGAAVLLLSHPSLTGMNTGSGLSGSTHWSNAVRSRLYLRGLKADDDDSIDQRELEVMKVNHARPGEKVRLRYRRGVFVLDGSPSALERNAAEQRIDEVFLRCLDTRTTQGINTSHAPQGRNYAPTMFARMPEAGGLRRAAFQMALERLLSAGRIRVETSGPESKQRSKLVRVKVEGTPR